MPPTSRQAPSPSDQLKIPRHRPLGGLVNLVLVILAVAVAAVVAFTLLSGTGQVEVPDLTGLTVEQAGSELVRVGLTLSAPEGGTEATVVGQDPPPGTSIDEGGTVRVSLSPDTSQVTVPDVSGRSTDEARRLLTAVGLNAGALLSDTSSDAPAGTVTRQEPEAGALVPEESTVALWVASSANSQVPDLTGLTQREAEERAGAAGLTLQVLREVTDEVMPGLVFEQSPAAGGAVAPGTTIVVVVNGAAGPDPATTPDGAGGTGQVDSGGGPSGGDAGTGTVPAPYEALAAAYPFTVLYPSQLPAGFVLEAGPGNPRQLSDQQGDLAFEVRYVDPTRPGARLSLMEGGLFELGVDEATTVDVRGHAGSLGVVGTTVVLSWDEGVTHYMITADGLDASQVVAFASMLVPAPAP